MNARDQFQQAVEDDLVSYQIIIEVWDCEDIMPRSLCDELDLPDGSSYGDGARKAHQLMPRVAA